MQQSEFVPVIRNSLVGKKCWYVSSGAVGTTFQLALGKKVRRTEPLRNDSHPVEYREYEGETNLLVWCTWRLDRSASVLTSADDETGTVCSQLDSLLGKTIQSVDIALPGWDLTLQFEDQLTLSVFCDHVPGDPSYDGNWYLTLSDRLLCAGPGAALHVTPREDAAH